MRALQTGQTTLDGNIPGLIPLAEQASPDNAESDRRTVTPEESSHGFTTAVETAGGTSGSNGDLVFQHYEPNGHAKRDESTDVEML